MQKREINIPEPIYHYSAILSGDYYMFDTIDEGNQTSSVVHNSDDLNNSQTNESNQIRKTLVIKIKIDFCFFHENFLEKGYNELAFDRLFGSTCSYTTHHQSSHIRC